MSMTDLKALVLSWEMGARKLPAAPALGGFSVNGRFGGVGCGVTYIT